MPLHQAQQVCLSVSSLQLHANNPSGAIKAGESMHASPSTTAEHDKTRPERYSPPKISPEIGNFEFLDLTGDKDTTDDA